MSVRTLLKLASRTVTFVVRRVLAREPSAVEEIRRDAEALLRDASQRGRRPVVATWAALMWDVVARGALNDMIGGVRSFSRDPRFAVSVSVLFGLGIAVTATVFAVVDAVLLRPLPYHEPERIVSVWETAPDRLREGPSPGNVLDWTARNDVFDALTAWMKTAMTLRGSDGGAPVTGVQVTRGFFDVFRTPPLLGRTFTDTEYVGASWNAATQFIGREPILVLSHRLWVALGSDSSLVGKTISIEGRAWRVVGVMPPQFAAPDVEAAFWTPWDVTTSYRGARFPNGPPRDFRFLRVAARLKPDVSIDVAGERMAMLASVMAAEQPQTNAGWSIRVVPYGRELVEQRRADLIVVFAAVGALLLLVCANIAGLSVARASSRARELALRMALGAGRERLVRQMLSEAVLIATVSLVIAIVLTQWWLSAAVAFAPPDIPRLHEVRFDARVVVFAGAVAFLVTLAAGVLPALRGTRVALAPVLRDGSAASGDNRLRLRRLIVIAEIAGALLLLVGAGLLIRTVTALHAVDPGFNPENVLVLRITPDASRYRTGAQGADYYRRVLAQLREVPAVTSAAAASRLPLSEVGSDFDRPFWREGARPSGGEAPEADIRMVTPDYFATIGRVLRSGREFSDADTQEAKRVVVVNEQLARSTWPGEDPIGRALMLDYQGGVYPYEVVGIARDARYGGPRSEIRPEIFIPHAQNPYLVMNVIARTSIDPRAVAETARAYALRVDPEQPVHSLTTMSDLVAESMEQDRFGAALLTLFSVAGLLVASTGVYSLCAFMVAQRRREIAVRLAIGASPGGVRRMVLMEAGGLAVIGAAVGLVLALAGAQVIGTVLFGVRPYDPLTLVVTTAVLIAIVMAATWMPARDATRIDPASVMRGS